MTGGFELRAEWPEDLDHISATSLKMFVRCPEQWRERYVLGKRVPPAGALIQGRADHTAIETHFQHQIDHVQGLTTDDVREVFAQTFEDEIDKEGGYDEVDWGATVTSPGDRRKVAAETKDQGTRLVAVYHSEVAPFVFPQEVETEFSIELPDLPVKLVGRLDLVALDFSPVLMEPVDQTQKIIERKTSKRKGVQPDAKLQGGIYQLVKPLPVDFHMSLKHKVPWVDWGTSELRQEYTDRTAPRYSGLVTALCAQIGSFYKKYGPDSPWPGYGLAHPWACDYCGFRADCAWVD